MQWPLTVECGQWVHKALLCLCGCSGCSPLIMQAPLASTHSGSHNSGDTASWFVFVMRSKTQSHVWGDASNVASW